MTHVKQFVSGLTSWFSQNDGMLKYRLAKWKAFSWLDPGQAVCIICILPYDL